MSLISARYDEEYDLSIWVCLHLHITSKYFRRIIFLDLPSSTAPFKTIRISNCGLIYYDVDSIPQNNFYEQHPLLKFCWDRCHTWIKLTVPIVRQPQERAHTKCHSELSSHIIIIQGFVIPISVSEHDTAHYFFILWSNYIQLFSFLIVFYLFIIFFPYQ